MKPTIHPTARSAARPQGWMRRLAGLGLLAPPLLALLLAVSLLAAAPASAQPSSAVPRESLGTVSEGGASDTSLAFGPGGVPHVAYQDYANSYRAAVMRWTQSALPPVNGACGSADGLPVTTAPTANLCSAGSQSAVTGDSAGPWAWSCSGSGGGSDASCQAPAFSPVTRFEGPSPTGTGTVTVDLAGGGPFCGFTGTPAMVAAVPGARPAGIVFPHGLFDFRASHCEPGSTITLTMKLPAALPETAKHYKWGPAPGNTTAHWQEMATSIAGDTVTFSLTDGGQGDDDLAANGSIVDPSGPGIPDGGDVIPIPTLSQWSLLLLSLLAVGLGARRLRRA